jgi:hypothetical protein
LGSAARANKRGRDFDGDAAASTIEVAMSGARARGLPAPESGVARLVDKLLEDWRGELGGDCWWWWWGGGGGGVKGVERRASSVGLRAKHQKAKGRSSRRQTHTPITTMYSTLIRLRLSSRQ